MPTVVVGVEKLLKGVANARLTKQSPNMARSSLGQGTRTKTNSENESSVWVATPRLRLLEIRPTGEVERGSWQSLHGVVDGHIRLQSEALQIIIVDNQGSTWDVGRAGGRGRTGVGEGGPVQAIGFFFNGGPPVPVEVAVKGRDVTMTNTI